MKEKKLKFTVLVEEDLLRKFGYVAEYNARSANREGRIPYEKTNC